MKKTVKLIVVGLIGLGIVIGGLGLAYAGNGSNANSTGVGAFANVILAKFRPGVRPGTLNEQATLNDIATYLGVPVDTLKTDLRNGQTLAQIAVAQGKTEDDLINFVVSKRTDELKTALADGKITQAQYDDAVKNLPTRVKEMVERNFKNFGKGLGRGFKRGSDFGKEPGIGLGL